MQCKKINGMRIAYFHSQHRGTIQNGQSVCKIPRIVLQGRLENSRERDLVSEQIMEGC